MSSADRRQAEILELLYMHEKCNVNDFVERFGVSRRTITSDIVVLTRKHNIKSKSGPHGGIEIDRDLKTDEVPYLTDFETSWQSAICSSRTAMLCRGKISRKIFSAIRWDSV